VSALLSKNGGKSSIYITQKRLSYTIDKEIDGTLPFSDLPADVKPILHDSTPKTKSYPVLIRITDGNKDKSKKMKLSTVVQPENLDLFWNEYTNILKTGFVGLKKKSKKKAKKASKSVNA
jgi:hypothetical protein